MVRTSLRFMAVIAASVVAVGVAAPVQAVVPAPSPSATASPTPAPSPTPTPSPTTAPTPTPPKPAAVPRGLTGVVTKGGTTLVLPLVAKSYTIASTFGPRCMPVPGASTFHYGLDMAVADGTAIHAVAAGTVTSVKMPAAGAAGYVTVRSVIDGAVRYIAYVHPWNPGKYVKVGQAVAVGQRIADVGASGPATGPHLHLEVWRDAFYGTGTALDPAKWLTSSGLAVKALAAADRSLPAPTRCTYYATTTLNVRAAASASSRLLASVAANGVMSNVPGTKVNQFVPVTVVVGGRTVKGWVHSGYITQRPTYTTKRVAVVRTSASTRGAVAVRLGSGAHLTGVGSTRGWYQVTYGSKRGWISAADVRAGSY
jgi:uncharacterized protein YgiM (DUF1202 family)